MVGDSDANAVMQTCNCKIDIIVMFFHISAQNIDCGFTLEPPQSGGFNEYPQSMF